MKKGSNPNTSSKAGARGQTMKSATGRDDSSYAVNNSEAMHGRKMGGSTSNIGHSLSGASAVQHAKGK